MPDCCAAKDKLRFDRKYVVEAEGTVTMAMRSDALVGKSVWLKVDFLSSPVSVTVDGVESDGLWCQSADIINQVVQDSHKPKNTFVGASVFVPNARVQYILCVPSGEMAPKSA